MMALLKKIGRWIIAVVLVLIAGLYSLLQQQDDNGARETSTRPTSTRPEPAQPNAGHARTGRQADNDNAMADSAFSARRSDQIMTVEGMVVHILADDNEGSRHQRFLLELPSGLTLKISHNIDLAPRIGGLRKNTRARVHGEYEWNDKGGVIHWTHHDPKGWREGGWIEYDGRRYE